MKYRWEVDIKEDSPDPDEEYYEVSVLRSDNLHGRESWGWSGDSKIVIDNGEENKAQAIAAARILCEALNNGKA